MSVRIGYIERIAELVSLCYVSLYFLQVAHRIYLPGVLHVQDCASTQRHLANYKMTQRLCRVRDKVLIT